jgi:hypothetical protein
MKALSARQWLQLGVALALLNSSLSFHNVWPTLWITMRAELSMEIAALVLLLALYHRYIGSPSNRLLILVAGVLLFMALGRYMEVTAPALYGRAVNIYWDAQHLPAVAAMLAGAAPLYLTIAVILGVAALFGLTFWLLRWSLTQVRRALEVQRVAKPLRIAAAGIVALYFLGYYASLPTLGWYSIPVSQTYARQAGFVIRALGGSNAMASLPTTSPLSAIDLTALPGNDVIVTFVESYGATAYDAESVALALDGPRRALAAAIESTERRVVSAFVEPPTFGGGSWLSHASFMTGLNVAEAASYDTLLTQSRPTLAKLFAAKGFRTIALMPGLKNEWPEGSFYGFDEIYGASRLDYSGPEFGWWRIPDQFALAKVAELELSARDRAPVFLFFPTISTHMPFRPTPPYQADWQRIASTTPYTDEDLGNRLNRTPEWLNLRPSYADALAYTYTYWSGYLTEHHEQDFLLVLVGDHQPPASVSGEGARWDVPVHVITRDTDLIDQLVSRGFEPGLRPAPTPVGSMHELSVWLLR